MSKIMEQGGGGREPVVTAVAVGGGTRLVMLKTTASGVGNKEGRRGRNTTELNQNQTLG